MKRWRWSRCSSRPRGCMSPILVLVSGPATCAYMAYISPHACTDSGCSPIYVVLAVDLMLLTWRLPAIRRRLIVLHRAHSSWLFDQHHFSQHEPHSTHIADQRSMLSLYRTLLIVLSFAYAIVS
ncbi:hypothetical protein PENSPDRAFT_428233 [Peniophora sp. CONT]|nr:hypothetical protein PENSPDRAFT_428233 [Peniophora sp. CONT]